MQYPVQITFHGVSPRPQIGALILERSSRLDRFREHIIRCRVTIAVPHRHRRCGRHYRVHVDITTALGNVRVTLDPDGERPQRLDVMVREAFDSATRQLDQEARRRRAA